MDRQMPGRAPDLATVTQALDGFAKRGHNAYLLGFLAGLRLKMRPDDAEYPLNPHPEDTAQFSQWDSGFGDAILGRGPLATLANFPEVHRMVERAAEGASAPAVPQ